MVPNWPGGTMGGEGLVVGAGRRSGCAVRRSSGSQQCIRRSRWRKRALFAPAVQAHLIWAVILSLQRDCSDPLIHRDPSRMPPVSTALALAATSADTSDLRLAPP